MEQAQATSPRGANLLIALVGFLLLGGAGRLVYIEYAEGAALREAAEDQQSHVLHIPAQRGDVLDVRGRVLAGSTRRPSIFIDPKEVRDPRFVAYTIGPILDWDPAELEQKILDWRTPNEHRGPRRFVWLRRQITEQQRSQFEQARKERDLYGVGMQFEPQREYPNGRLASHVLGFVSAGRDADGDGTPDKVGLAGVEQRFNSELRGTAGRQLALVDRSRQRVSTPLDFEPPRDGATVVLTIDAQIQELVEQALDRAVERHAPTWALAGVIDPHSGEVLALAARPDYDPSDPIPTGTDPDAGRRALINPAIAAAFEPGSIFKPFIAGLAFDEGAVDLDEVFDIRGPTRFFGRRQIRDVRGYDTLRLTEVISKSSNIGMGLLGDRLGNERLHQYVRDFGFGDTTGIELPGEATGLVNPFDQWGSYSTQSIPIGQEIGVTAIQMLAAFSVFANDGVLYQPRIVRGLLDPAGEVIADWSEPVMVRRVMSRERSRLFRETALRRVVSPEGTGRRAMLEGYELFGKTGTAQVSLEGRKGYGQRRYTGSFVGGGPVDDPKVVVIVSIHLPTENGYYGGMIAAPVAGEILSGTLHYLQVGPTSAPEADTDR